MAENGEIIKVHGKTYRRTGKCLRCGACGCEKSMCLHFIWQEGLATCTIYDSRNEEICEMCTAYMTKKYGKRVVVDHRGCVRFPDYYNVRVVNEGVCGFKFEEVTEE